MVSDAVSAAKDNGSDPVSALLPCPRRHGSQAWARQSRLRRFVQFGAASRDRSHIAPAPAGRRRKRLHRGRRNGAFPGQTSVGGLDVCVSNDAVGGHVGPGEFGCVGPVLLRVSPWTVQAGCMWSNDLRQISLSDDRRTIDAWRIRKMTSLATRCGPANRDRLRRYRYGCCRGQFGRVYIVGRTFGVFAASRTCAALMFVRRNDAAGNEVWTCESGRTDRVGSELPSTGLAWSMWRARLRSLSASRRVGQVDLFDPQV